MHADYIDFLRTVTPNSVDEHMNQLRRFNMGSAGEADCPVFDGLFEYCQVGLVHGPLPRALSFKLCEPTFVCALEKHQTRDARILQYLLWFRCIEHAGYHLIRFHCSFIHRACTL